MTRRGLLRHPVFAALQLLLPERCPGCGRPSDAPFAAPFCRACTHGLRRDIGPCCDRCGLPLVSPAGRLCSDCLKQPPAFARQRSYAVYAPPASTMLHLLKYRGRRHLARLLGARLADVAPRGMDLVLPVPLHPARLFQREFNQSALLARCVARALARPLRLDVLDKRHDTPPQAGLSRRERVRLDCRIFHVARPDAVRRRRVLLVDDVCTTGATLDACARALLDAGAGRVEAITVARSTPEPPPARLTLATYPSYKAATR